MDGGTVPMAMIDRVCGTHVWPRVRCSAANIAEPAGGYVDNAKGALPTYPPAHQQQQKTQILVVFQAAAA